MHGTLHIDKIFVDEIGGGLRKAGDCAVAGGFGGLGNSG